MKKQTAVEWLVERLILSFGDEIKPLIGFFIIAKEMEKEQTINLYYEYEIYSMITESNVMTFEQYYEKTYGGGDE
jgi:hypothetical protein